MSGDDSVGLNMLKPFIVNGTLIACLAVSQQAAPQEAGQQDCALADRYYGLAQDRISSFNVDEAEVYLERAGAACLRYTYFQELAELRMKSVDEQDRRLAAEEFVSAYALASTDAEASRTLWKYGALLNQEGDPQNADRLIREARRLDPDNQEIAALAAQIETQIENPTAEQLTRGLSEDIYKPLRMRTAGRRSSGAGSSSPADRAPDEDRGSIRIPIRFEYNSTTVDPETARNIRVLADSLTADTFRGQNFRFIGHADVRGDAQYNMELSRRRAETIYDAIIDIEPALAGRIQVSGMGESAPIAFGNTEDAHRLNRRLQVLIN